MSTALKDKLEATTKANVASDLHKLQQQKIILPAQAREFLFDVFLSLSAPKPPVNFSATSEQPDETILVKVVDFMNSRKKTTEDRQELDTLPNPVDEAYNKGMEDLTVFTTSYQDGQAGGRYT